jgi:KDO2-lipid IV(A) lauroyltransferase
MSRRKNALLIHAEYIPLRLLLGGLQVMPLAWSKTFCRHLMNLLMIFFPRRRELIDRQLRDSFPERSEEERREWARESVENLADGLATFAQIPALIQHGIDDWVVLEGAEHIHEAYRQGRGMITFTAHYGCWEIMAVYVTFHFPNVAMLVRPLDNPLLEKMVREIRGSGGGSVVDSRRAFQDGVALLRHNGILGILIDQNFHKGGVFVNFFNRPASANPLVPLLARRTRCAVLPMHNVWKNGKVHIICEAPVTLSSNPILSEAIGEDTQTLTRIAEGWIRENPGQWMWLHDRWKRSPQPSDRIYQSPDAISRAN